MATVDSGRAKLRSFTTMARFLTEVMENAPRCWSRDLSTIVEYVRALENGYTHRDEGACTCARDV